MDFLSDDRDMERSDRIHNNPVRAAAQKHCQRLSYGTAADYQMDESNSGMGSGAVSGRNRNGSDPEDCQQLNQMHAPFGDLDPIALYVRSDELGDKATFFL